MTRTGKIPVGTRAPFPEPQDVAEAIQAWGANCGPAAIAAITERSMAEVRPRLDGFAKRRYMNPTHVKAALLSLGFVAAIARTSDRWPTHGLMFVQWDGPWNDESVFEQYRHTHWIAVRGEWVYDVNVASWAARWWWLQEVAPVLSRHGGGTGTHTIRTSYEVAVSELQGPRPCPSGLFSGAHA